MFWFLIGYTSKLAGTETGIVAPVSTSSLSFGQPFMPRNPNDYASLLGEKAKKHRTQVYLVNTGWEAAALTARQAHGHQHHPRHHQGRFERRVDKAASTEDKTFHINIPLPARVPDAILQPRNTWKDPEAFAARARKLAGEFSAHFDRVYGNKNLPDGSAASARESRSQRTYVTSNA